MAAAGSLPGDLPAGTAPTVSAGWTHWDRTRGTPHRPRALRPSGTLDATARAWHPQAVLDDLTAALAAERVYDSIDDLAATMQAQLAQLAGQAAFRPWLRLNPEFKPRLSGLVATPAGVRRVTALLDTGATHSFICARLAAALGLPPSGEPGPRSVATAAAGGQHQLGAPVLLHLCLGDSFREAMSISPMDLEVGDDIILGWDWISSHDLRHLYQAGQVSLRSGAAQLQLDLLPPEAAVPRATMATVIGHGEFRRWLRQLDGPAPASRSPPDPNLARTHRRPRRPRPDSGPKGGPARCTLTMRSWQQSRRRSAKLLAFAAVMAARPTRKRLLPAASPMAWRPSATARSFIWRRSVRRMPNCGWRAWTTRRLLPSRQSMPTFWARSRRACPRTAAWSSSSRRGAPRCRGHAR